MPPQSSNENPGASQVLARYPEVAVTGAGLIGISWAALFLANGLRVRVYDPRPDLEKAVRDGLANASPALRQLGYSTEGFNERLRIETTLEAAAQGADLVQESGPEQIEFKCEFFAKLEQFVKPGALLFSSTSSLRATNISRDMKHPERMMVGHPFNPPHVMPLVEIVPGQRTSQEAVQQALAFYRALGKAPVVLLKEINGFVGNRLQAAMLRECIYLVEQGVISVGDLDTLMTNSLGLRWATVGPFKGMHLGGGPGGIKHFLDHLGGMFQGLFQELGDARINDAETIARLTAQTEAAYGPMPNARLADERDRKQLGVLQSHAAVMRKMAEEEQAATSGVTASK
jgi:ketoreductase RED1